MENEKKLISKSELVAKISIGTVLGICLGLLIAYLLFRPTSYEFAELATRTSGPVDLGLAKNSLETYRNEGALAALAANWRGKTNGIIHDTTEFSALYKNIFLKFVNSHEPRKNYEWRLGLYPNIVYEGTGANKIARLNIYFIPTMYDAANNKALDYLSELYDPQSPYNKIIAGSGWKTGDSYIFDQGTLFP
jgi:hypothetical protein